MKKFKLVINTRVEINIDDVVYKTVIQDVVNDGFLISIPVVRGEYLTLRNGEEIEIDSYADEKCIYRLTCNVIAKVQHDNLPMYKISLPKDVKRIQRRNYVRVNILEQVNYSRLDNEGKNIKNEKAVLVDLSAGGVRISTKETLYYGDRILLHIDIEGIDVKVKGVIVRIETSEDKNKFYGVRFEDMVTADSEKIIKCLFNIMRKQNNRV